MSHEDGKSIRSDYGICHLPAKTLPPDCFGRLGAGAVVKVGRVNLNSFSSSSSSSLPCKDELNDAISVENSIFPISEKKNTYLLDETATLFDASRHEAHALTVVRLSTITFPGKGHH